MTIQLDAGAPAPDARRASLPRPSLTVASAVTAMLLGLALLVPCAAWCLLVAWNVLEQNAHPRLLVLVAMPSCLVLAGVVLCHGGFTHLRAAVGWLDRRRAH